MPGPVPVGMPLDMLERRPDLIAAERRVAAAFNRVGEAKAARLPTIRLNASVAAMSSDVLQLKDDYRTPPVAPAERSSRRSTTAERSRPRSSCGLRSRRKPWLATAARCCGH